MNAKFFVRFGCSRDRFCIVCQRPIDISEKNFTGPQGGEIHDSSSAAGHVAFGTRFVRGYIHIDGQHRLPSLPRRCA